MSDRDRLDVHLFLEDDALDLLRGILRRLKTIEDQGARLMALTQETKDLLGRVDAATTQVGLRIQNLIDQINSGTVTDQAEIVSILSPIADHLTEFAHDPANPFPALPKKK